MTKVCISGYYGFDNVGDEAILLSMIENLRQEFPDIEIAVLSDKPAETAAEYGVEAYDRWKWGQIHKAIMASDILLSGGGGLLQDATGKKSIMYYTHIMKMAMRRKRPVFIFSQGVGPVTDSWNQSRIAKVLRKAAKITVRDDESADLLHSWGLRRGRIRVTADPVLLLGSTERRWSVERFVKALDASLPQTEEEVEIEISLVDEKTLHTIMAENAAKLEAEAAKNVLHKPMNAAAFAEVVDKEDAEAAATDEASQELITEEAVTESDETTAPETDAPAEEAEEPVLAVEGYGIMGQHPSLWAGSEEKLAVFSIRQWDNLPIADIAAAGDMTVQAGYKVVLLPFQYPADIEVSQQIKEAMTEPAEVFDAKVALTPREIMTVMDNADFVFGMRLHSLIMAAVTKTPFASLSYNPKVRSFVNQLGLSVTGDLEYYDSAEFLKNFEAALGALGEVVAAIDDKLPELQEKAESVLDLLHLLLDRIARRNARKDSSYVRPNKSGETLGTEAEDKEADDLTAESDEILPEGEAEGEATQEAEIINAEAEHTVKEETEESEQSEKLEK